MIKRHNGNRKQIEINLRKRKKIRKKLNNSIQQEKEYDTYNEHSFNLRRRNSNTKARKSPLEQEK